MLGPRFAPTLTPVSICLRRCEEALLQNTVADITTDDLASLRDDDPAAGAGADAPGAAGGAGPGAAGGAAHGSGGIVEVQSFTDLVYSRNKVRVGRMLSCCADPSRGVKQPGRMLSCF